MDTYMIVVDGKVKEEIETAGRSKEAMSYVLIDRFYHWKGLSGNVNIYSSLTGSEYRYV
ncbi:MULTISPECIES: hypothetical protein [Paenibacillus]|uniref:Uncharacterized protein n=1 Tax=Paenibacillus peoriae TaxID=59893 RepID=A0ABU1QJ08_9BACL|nr:MULTISPECIES: hypothetical protein [Paenibacillus]MDR6779412.1 hypothetical protein [Paenibacillus peoriae]